MTASGGTGSHTGDLEQARWSAALTGVHKKALNGMCVYFYIKSIIITFLDKTKFL